MYATLCRSSRQLFQCVNFVESIVQNFIFFVRSSFAQQIKIDRCLRIMDLVAEYVIKLKQRIYIYCHVFGHRNTFQQDCVLTHEFLRTRVSAFFEPENRSSSIPYTLIQIALELLIYRQ